MKFYFHIQDNFSVKCFLTARSAMKPDNNFSFMTNDEKYFPVGWEVSRK